MKKSNKILLAMASLWPFVYTTLFFVFMFSSFFFLPHNGSSDDGVFPYLFMIIFPLHLLSMLLIMGLNIFYIVNVFKNDRVDKDKKVLWAVVLFMGNVIAMPIYWYLYIWRENPVPMASEPLPLNRADTSNWVSATTSSAKDQYVPPAEPPNWR